MGSHYVPQKYLRGFAKPGEPDMIAMFNRKKGEYRHASISKVAQEPGFYPPEIEKNLNDEVERPANIVLDKLRKDEPITIWERFDFAVYIATMLSRVPHNRLMMARLAPRVLVETVDDLKLKILAMGKLGTLNPDLVEMRLREADETFKKYKDDPSQLIQDRIRSPWSSLNVFEAIFRMTWRILRAQDQMIFVTSDNPVFFFEGIGLANADSEFSFPLSSSLLLHGCHDGCEDYEKIEITDYMVKELNRRTVNRSTQMIFSCREETWIEILGRQNPAHHNLNRIQWIKRKPKHVSLMRNRRG